ncbi:MAG: type II secretion system F family protein [Candidatus Thorarchaeota archaeon]
MVVSVTSSGIITLLLSLFLPIFSALVLGITIGLVSWLILLNKILVKYHKQLVQIERATPYVLEELVTLFTITGSVFESIEYVSKGEHGAISSAFAEMIEPLNLGVPPEQLLRKYAITQPSITLRRGLLTFIQFIESSVANLKAVISDAHENLQRKYERRTLQWESRMMIIVGVLVFLPIIFILGVAIRGLANQPLVLVLPIFQFILSKIMISALLPKEMILLGE